jgi:hypothetical protein
MLVNDTYVPLFPYTSNLGYILSLGVDVNLSTWIEFPYTFFVFLSHEIQMYINEYIGLEYNPIEMKLLSANKPCVSNEIWTDSSISVLIYIKVFIYSRLLLIIYHDKFITGFIARIARRVPLVEEVLLTFPEHTRLLVGFVLLEDP